MGCCGESVHEKTPTYLDPPEGPIKNRGCTDVICLGLFLAFIAGWIVLAMFAFTHGNPERLVMPTDSMGNICGIGKHQNKSFLFFFDLTKCITPSIAITGCPTPQVCVEKCPDYTTYYRAPTFTKEMLICKDDVDKSQDDVNKLVQSGLCGSYYIKSSPVPDRVVLDPQQIDELSGHDELPKLRNPLIGRCLPMIEDLQASIENQFGEKINSTMLNEGSKFLAELMNTREVGEKIFQDFKMCWWMMLIGVVLAMVLSFLWIVLIRIFGGLMVWISLFFVAILFGFGCWYSFHRWDELKHINGSDAEFHFSTNIDSYLQLQNTWLAFGIIAASVLVIILLIMIFLRKRIAIAIALINASSKAVGSIMCSLFFPIFPFVLHLAIFAIWGVIAVYLASYGKPIHRVYVRDKNCNTNYKNFTDCDPNNFTVPYYESSDVACAMCSFAGYGTDANIHRAQIYNLFGLFWSMFFIDGLSQMILAGGFASWYWAFRKPDDVPALPIAASFWRTFRYHLGSIAFGSLIIAIVRMIRVFLEYLDHKLKKHADNGFVKCIMCCLKCFFWCLEKFLKFINKNAYIMVAIYGKNFCTSAKNAFSLLIRNVIRVVVLDKVTDFLLFLGKLVVVGSLGVLSFFFFTGKIMSVEKYVPSLNYYFIPIIVVIVGSYIISAAFFGVYEAAVDTIFLCFLEDCERNDGSAERPYYMSKDLMKILGKHNKNLT